MYYVYMDFLHLGYIYIIIIMQFGLTTAKM